jgi:hypothetical protein
MATPSFVAYIDESGDEGFAFEKGSSEWFILSAVIFPKSIELETVKLVDYMREKLKKPPKTPLHFRQLKHEQRLPYIGLIAEAPIKAISVLIHKPSITRPEIFLEKYRLYFYAVRFLVERISWYCRDHYRKSIHSGDGFVEIIFSNRSSMSYKELRDYLELLRAQTGYYDVRIEWRYINIDSMKALPSAKRRGLQIADAIAGSFFYGVQCSGYGFAEDRYARMLKPIIYSYRRNYLGYGLKFFPIDVDTAMQKQGHLKWIAEHYK